MLSTGIWVRRVLGTSSRSFLNTVDLTLVLWVEGVVVGVEVSVVVVLVFSIVLRILFVFVAFSIVGKMYGLLFRKKFLTAAFGVVGLFFSRRASSVFLTVVVVVVSEFGCFSVVFGIPVVGETCTLSWWDVVTKWLIGAKSVLSRTVLLWELGCLVEVRVIGLAGAVGVVRVIGSLSTVVGPLYNSIGSLSVESILLLSGSRVVVEQTLSKLLGYVGTEARWLPRLAVERSVEHRWFALGNKVGLGFVVHQHIAEDGVM